MKLSQNCIDLIKKFEGCRLSAYRCPSGVLTIGYGHTQGVKSGDVITAQQAEDLLKFDLKNFENEVNKVIKIPLNQNQFDALVSFSFNCGINNLKKLVNNRNIDQIASAMLLYNKSKGKILNGLVKRRQAEYNLFLL